jgi:hypothetical protein
MTSEIETMVWPSRLVEMSNQPFSIPTGVIDPSEGSLIPICLTKTSV